MVKSTELDFTTPMMSSAGKPMLNLSSDIINRLGIKPNDDLEQFRDQIPEINFGEVLDAVLDLIPFGSNKHFAVFNNILIDIRNSKAKESKIITIEKSDLETLKAILEKAIVNKSELNRKAGFLIEVIDQCMANIINENKPEQITS